HPDQDGPPARRNNPQSGSAPTHRPHNSFGHSRRAGDKTAAPGSGGCPREWPDTTPRYWKTWRPRQTQRRETGACGVGPPVRDNISRAFSTWHNYPRSSNKRGIGPESTPRHAKHEKQSVNLVLTVVEITAPVFLLGLIGFVWVKLGLDYPMQFVTRMAMTLGVPCLIFVSLMQTDI